MFKKEGTVCTVGHLMILVPLLCRSSSAGGGAAGPVSGSELEPATRTMTEGPKCLPYFSKYGATVLCEQATVPNLKKRIYQIIFTSVLRLRSRFEPDPDPTSRHRPDRIRSSK